MCCRTSLTWLLIGGGSDLPPRGEHEQPLHGGASHGAAEPPRAPNRVGRRRGGLHGPWGRRGLRWQRRQRRFRRGVGERPSGAAGAARPAPLLDWHHLPHRRHEPRRVLRARTEGFWPRSPPMSQVAFNYHRQYQYQYSIRNKYSMPHVEIWHCESPGFYRSVRCLQIPAL